MTAKLAFSRADCEVTFVTEGGYECIISHEKWVLSRDKSINWSTLRNYCDDSFVDTFKVLLSSLATVTSAAHISSQFDRMRHFCKWQYELFGQVHQVGATPLANYRAQLCERTAWYVSVISGTFRQWAERELPGIEEGVVPMLDGWRLSGNRKGEAVQLRSLTEGALSELEFEALNSALTTAFEMGHVALDDFALVMLAAFSGRRPSQLGDLKGEDFISSQSADGLVEFALNVPRRKQRGRPFRSSFKPFALNSDNGSAVAALIASNNARLDRLSVGVPNPLAPSDLPLFPDWHMVGKFHRLSPSVRAALPPDTLHLRTQTISKHMCDVVEQLELISERTGEALNFFPTRLRRTVGTRAAQEGYGPLLIAELLDHSDTQNANIYVENIPEHVDAINRAVASQLAPIAQAFTGKLVDNESQAVRGEDPSSRVRSQTGQATGTCGHHGFCGACAPIACYTCANFQPWLFGPHEAVLEYLISDQDRISKITGDKQISNIMNRTILAVTRVIQLCSERKNGIGSV